jgi:hypothetical protein
LAFSLAKVEEAAATKIRPREGVPIPDKCSDYRVGRGKQQHEELMLVSINFMEECEEAAPKMMLILIGSLLQTRKELLKGGFRDRHFNTSSILLGGGTTFAIAGAYNTYLRTGKLFPGPHLYAGAGERLRFYSFANCLAERRYRRFRLCMVRKVAFILFVLGST